MNQKHVIVSASILLLLIAGMFFFASLKSKEIEQRVEDPVQKVATVKTPYDIITRIDAKHFFSNGTHTLVGEILMPTPCDLLNWDTRIAESYPEQVTIGFAVVNNTTSCAQVVTSQRFNVVFSASEQASIYATLNGKSLEINLIPPAEGETPDNYELFLKG